MLAHPRSGSTTLASVLGVFPAVTMLNEPFNPTRRTQGWGHDYLTDLRNTDLEQCVRLIRQSANGVKHILGQLDPQQDIEFFRAFKTRIFLTRRNRLRSVVSSMVAEQTHQWHRWGKPIDEAPLAPLPLDRLARSLDELNRNVERARHAIADIDHHAVEYEDLFGEDVPLETRLDRVIKLSGELGLDPPDIEQVNEILDRLHDGRHRMNPPASYIRIPNFREIERDFGGGEFGSLTNEIAGPA